MRRIVRLLAPPTVLALAACPEPEPVAVPEPPPLVQETDTPFEDPSDLLESIEEGTFAEEVGIVEEIEAVRLPAPITVEFVRGTAVPADQEDEIRQLAEALQTNERFQVDLTGCSDPPGSEALNRRISQARANSVAARLEALGVPSEQLGEVVGRGEDCEEPQRAVLARVSFREASRDAAAQASAARSDGRQDSDG